MSYPQTTSHEAMVSTNAPSDPTMIAIVHESKLETLPAQVYADLQRCESYYHRGNYYITVPTRLYRQWPALSPAVVP